MATNLAEVDEVVFRSNTDGSAVANLRTEAPFRGAQGRTTAEMNRALDWAAQHPPARASPSHVAVPRDRDLSGCDSKRIADRAQPLLLEVDRPTERQFGRRKFHPQFDARVGPLGAASAGNILTHVF